MTQSFRVYTPAFHKLINEFVIEQIREYNVQRMTTPELPEISEKAIYESCLHLLQGYWYGGVEPTTWTIPENLQCPEYVEYEFDSRYIGHPIMPSMIPSSFTPVPVDEPYLRRLTDNMLDMTDRTKWAFEKGENPNEFKSEDPQYENTEDQFYDDPNIQDISDEEEY